MAALRGGPLTVAALATRLGVTPVKVRNAIDAVRRTNGKGAVVALGGSVFSLPA
jgi:DNA-binding GntR family transcriptional regulator